MDSIEAHAASGRVGLTREPWARPWGLALLSLLGDRSRGLGQRAATSGPHVCLDSCSHKIFDRCRASNLKPEVAAVVGAERADVTHSGAT